MKSKAPKIYLRWHTVFSITLPRQRAGAEEKLRIASRNGVALTTALAPDESENRGKYWSRVSRDGRSSDIQTLAVEWHWG
jgi:hypothetical protein